MSPLSQPFTSAKIHITPSILLCISSSMRGFFTASGPPNYRIDCNGCHPRRPGSDGPLRCGPRLSRQPANGCRPPSHCSDYFNSCSFHSKILLLPLLSSFPYPLLLAVNTQVENHGSPSRCFRRFLSQLVTTRWLPSSRTGLPRS